jgi:putative FmdB family regulatory protein
MITYEYACLDCNTVFEIQQRITDDPLKVCPKCQTETLEKVISGVGFILTGDGWFRNGKNGQ